MLDSSSGYKSILAERSVDVLRRHKLMSIPTEKGDIVGLGCDKWQCWKTISVGLKQQDSLLFFFFFLDIKLRHGNTSPAIILPFRMKILLLFSLSFAPWHNCDGGRHDNLMSRNYLGFIFLLVTLEKDEFLYAIQWLSLCHCAYRREAVQAHKSLAEYSC